MTGSTATAGTSFLVPDWPAPPTVKAISSLRGGGVSHAPFASLNLGLGSGDDAASVAHNRHVLRVAAGLPERCCWLHQVHGTDCIEADAARSGARADASHTRRAQIACVVMSADCLPVLLCSRSGDRVAAAHAGWRGLAAGVLENTVSALQLPGEQLLAWLGPAIGPAAYEVGAEVRAAFCDHDPGAASAFRPTRPGHWLADLYRLARQRLGAVGVEAVSGGELCTHADPSRFYSYRRDGRTGRMASFIWLDPGADGLA